MTRKPPESNQFLATAEQEHFRKTIVGLDTACGKLNKTFVEYCIPADRITDNITVAGFHIDCLLVYDSCEVEEELFIEETTDGMKITWITFRPDTIGQ